MKTVKFLNGEIRSVTSRAADIYVAKGQAELYENPNDDMAVTEEATRQATRQATEEVEEEKIEVKTKEEKVKRTRKTK